MENQLACPRVGLQLSKRLEEPRMQEAGRLQNHTLRMVSTTSSNKVGVHALEQNGTGRTNYQHLALMYFGGWQAAKPKFVYQFERLQTPKPLVAYKPYQVGRLQAPKPPGLYQFGRLQAGKP